MKREDTRRWNGEDECLDSDFEDSADEEVENIDDVRRDQFDVVRENLLETKNKISLDSDFLSWMLMGDIIILLCPFHCCKRRFLGP